MSTHAILLTIFYTCLAMAAAIIGCLVWALWPRRAKRVDPLVELYDAQPLALPAAPSSIADRFERLRAAAAVRRATMPDYPDSPEEIAERAEEAPYWQALQAESMFAEDAEALTPPHGDPHLAALVRAAVDQAMARRHSGDVVDAVVVPDAATTVAVAPPRDPDATGEWPVYEARPIAKDTGKPPKHDYDNDDGTDDDPKYWRPQALKKKIAAIPNEEYNWKMAVKAREGLDAELSWQVSRLRRAAEREEAAWRELTASITATLAPRRTERVLVPVRLLEAVG